MKKLPVLPQSVFKYGVKLLDWWVVVSGRILELIPIFSVARIESPRITNVSAARAVDER